MFSKKKERKQRSNNPFGMDLMQNFDINNMECNDDDDDDEELEAELHRLTTGDDIITPQPRRPARKKPVVSINHNITDNQEIPSDEELSGDDDDPVLLNELHSILGEEPEEMVEETQSPNNTSNGENNMETIKLLEERLVMYNTAVEKANNANESSKARRYGRGIKTLEKMLNDAKSGKNVDTANIPPALVQPPTVSNDDPADTASTVDTPNNEVPSAPIEDVVNEVSEPTSEPVPETPPAPVIDEEKLNLLKKRQHEYKTAALAWKKCGNVTEAVNLLKIAKQFDVVIAALNSGEPVDLSDMPPAPQLPQAVASNDVPAQESKEESEIQESTVEDSEPAPPAPVTGSDNIAAALKERLEVYQRTKVTAEEEGNSSKARRYGRICKQYEDAIKLQARGKSFAVAELPIPPGFPPIVIDSQPAPTPAAIPQRPKAPLPSVTPAENEEKPSPPPRIKKKPSGTNLSRAEKQTLFLQRRQAELKRAALTAKKDGDIETARDYLRQAKGLDPLIEASIGGFPVDLMTIPLSPDEKSQLNDGKIDAQSNDSSALMSSDDCQPANITGTDQEIYEHLEAQLIKQNKVCLATRDHAKALGDVAGYNRWERMALDYERDLNMLRVRKRDGLVPPQHHYEEKTYAIVKSCTDLTDSDLEISIIRGVNYPKDADTYVIYEFPYPSDNSPTDRTSTIKGTSMPEYDATFTLTGSVDRSSRQCQRAFKRHALKCQVWSKGGFFRSDSLLGTVTIKLQPLETQCILHDSFPLMNGRKATGGKLEVKIRLRNPITTKQIEKMTDKWLIIDY
ncbi:hypothetical protein PV327_003723 [Microctonus hyperodae]|uniref:C2 domain-containing protein n=2 Tax=Microctonus hyperodae TaxID=165561 RepID=A0AA39L1C4_MICHY|nr:hypothetical protein PV327_003723 [Microctonus hyperodae]